MSFTVSLALKLGAQDFTLVQPGNLFPFVLEVELFQLFVHLISLKESLRVLLLDSKFVSSQMLVENLLGMTEIGQGFDCHRSFPHLRNHVLRTSEHHFFDTLLISDSVLGKHRKRSGIKNLLAFINIRDTGANGLPLLVAVKDIYGLPVRRIK